MISINKENVQIIAFSIERNISFQIDIPPTDSVLFFAQNGRLLHFEYVTEMHMIILS